MNKRLLCFFRFLGTLDAYEGCERINLLDWLYTRLIGFDRALYIAKMLKP